MGGRRPRKLEDERDWLLERLAEKPDLTLHELLAEFADKREIVVACDTLWRFLKREVSASKKTIHASEQDRPDVARRRTWWRRLQTSLDPTRLVFIDETWTKTNMTRTRGWWPRGERLLAKVPHGHWKTMTFLAALRHDQITAPFVLDGPITAKASLPTSSISWCLRCGRATSSSWTILAPTRAIPSAKRSAQLAHTLCSCLPTRPISIPIEQAFDRLKPPVPPNPIRTLISPRKSNRVRLRPRLTLLQRHLDAPGCNRNRG